MSTQQMPTDPPPAATEKPFTLSDWIGDIMDGVGGFHDFERYEMPSWKRGRDYGIADFVIRSLANPKCQGSDRMLAEIQKRRAELSPQPTVPAAKEGT